MKNPEIKAEIETEDVEEFPTEHYYRISAHKESYGWRASNQGFIGF